MVIGIAGSRYNKKRKGTRSGKTVVALAMMHCLLKEEYKVPFIQFLKDYKSKENFKQYTPDKFVIQCKIASEDFITKQILADSINCTLEDLMDINYLNTPIPELRTHFIYIDGKLHKSIPDRIKAENYIKARNSYGEGKPNRWSFKFLSPTPIMLLDIIKKSFKHNIHHSFFLLSEIRKNGKEMVYFYPNLDNFHTFKFIENLGGATILVDNPTIKGNKKLDNIEKAFYKSNFDYFINNDKDIDSLYKKAELITAELINGVL